VATLPGYFHDTPGISASNLPTGRQDFELVFVRKRRGCLHVLQVVIFIRLPAFPTQGSGSFGFAVGDRSLLALNSDQLRHSSILFCMLQLAFRFSAIRWARAAFRSAARV
jgi:hypothetical protein